jgi:hypothetical protein
MFEREEEDCWGEWNEETQTTEDRCETRIEGRIDPLEIELTENSDDIVQELLNQFSSEHLIAGTDELTYKLDLSSICEEDDEALDLPVEPTNVPAAVEGDIEGDNEGDNEEETILNEGCLQELEELQIKARVLAADDGLQIELLATADAKTMVTLTMIEDQLSVQLDLAEVLAMVDELTDEEDLTVPSVAGVIGLALDLSDENQLALSLNIHEDIKVQGTIAEEIEIDLSVPATAKMLAIVLDKVSQSIQLSGQSPELIEKVRTRLVWADDEDDFEEGEPEEDRRTEDGPIRDLKLLFAGGEFDLNISLTDLAKTVVGFSIGANGFEITADDNSVIKALINPETDARVEVEFDHSEVDKDIFGINMLNELNEFKARLDFSALPELEIPEEVSDEYTFSFNGTADALPAIEITEENFKVASGTLTMEAAQAGVSFVAEAGQCIAGKEDEGEEGEESEDEHFLESIVAQVCQ